MRLFPSWQSWQAAWPDLLLMGVIAYDITQAIHEDDGAFWQGLWIFAALVLTFLLLIRLKEV